MRFLLSVLFISAFAIEASAQTPRAIWYYADTTPAVVATWTHTVTLNGVTVAGTPTCVAAGVNTNCSLALPAIPAGNNTLSVSPTVNGVSSETTITFNMANGPKLPLNPSIKVTVVITFPPSN